MQKSSIFEDKSDLQNEKQRIYSDFLQPDLYISQFLTIPDFNLKDPKTENSLFEKLKDQQIPVSIQTPILSKVKTTPKEIKKSCFHNFQKHLVTTIKALVNIGQNSFKEKQEYKCGMAIWRCFHLSKKMNKTLLCLTLGDLSKHSDQKLKEYGFQSLKGQYSCQMITNTQRIITSSIIQQLDGIDLQQVMFDRRIKNKKQFQAYFKGFLEQFQAGSLDRRMTKWTKRIRFESQNKGL